VSGLLICALVSQALFAKTFGGTRYDEAYSIIQTSDGGYAVAGEVRSFSVGAYDLLVLKIGPNGSYTGCVADCSPTVNTPSLSTSSPTVGANCAPTVSSLTPTVGTPNLMITEACPPAVEESHVLPGNRLTCSPLSEGLVFNAPADLIKIYSVDGRIAYSGQLRQGENRISLGRGVYLWQAGTYRGKAAVR